VAGEAPVHERDDGGDLRDIVAAVALPGDEELAALVLGKPLQPTDQEGVGVLGDLPVVDGLAVGGVPRHGEPDAGGDSRKITFATAHPVSSVPNTRATYGR
jgi:hypothetical protein